MALVHRIHTTEEDEDSSSDDDVARGRQAPTYRIRPACGYCRPALSVSARTSCAPSKPAVAHAEFDPEGRWHVKFQVERDALADAVSWAARGLPNRPPVPVLAGVLLEADAEGTLTLSAFDYEVSARVSVPADVSEAGRVLVSGRLLSDIARNLPGKPVDVVTEGSKVTVTCGATRFTLLTMPVEEYPTLPAMPEASGEISGDVFSQAVAQVTVAAGRDDTLPILTGVRME